MNLNLGRCEILKISRVAALLPFPGSPPNPVRTGAMAVQYAPGGSTVLLYTVRNGWHGGANRMAEFARISPANALQPVTAMTGHISTKRSSINSTVLTHR